MSECMCGYYVFVPPPALILAGASLPGNAPWWLRYLPSVPPPLTSPLMIYYYCMLYIGEVKTWRYDLLDLPGVIVVHKMRDLAGSLEWVNLLAPGCLLFIMQPLTAILLIALEMGYPTVDEVRLWLLMHFRLSLRRARLNQAELIPQRYHG